MNIYYVLKKKNERIKTQIHFFFKEIKQHIALRVHEKKLLFRRMLEIIHIFFFVKCLHADLIFYINEMLTILRRMQTINEYCLRNYF